MRPTVQEFAVTTLVKSYSRFVMVTLDVANRLKALFASERKEE